MGLRKRDIYIYSCTLSFLLSDKKLLYVMHIMVYKGLSEKLYIMLCSGFKNY